MLFDVPTIVPDNFYAWWRQRCAWSGGQFRLAVTNLSYSLRLPSFYLYMSLMVTFGAPFRWISLLHPNWILVFAVALYLVVLNISNWKHRDLALILFPIYGLINSMILTPLGLIFYVQMSRKDSNWGIIRHLSPKRAREERARYSNVAHAKSRRSAVRLFAFVSLLIVGLLTIDSVPGNQRPSNEAGYAINLDRPSPT